jgi:uncharacterized membrane protein YeaQ/YmgE (transglycosylase-associated protein family)
LERGAYPFSGSSLWNAGGFMNVIIRILVGGLTGWLTGKAVELEGRVKVEREGHLLDMIYGIVGAMVGEYLFFWIVIGKGNAFSDYATMVLGSVTVVGAARLVTARWRLIRSYKRNTSPSSFGVGRVNRARIEPLEAPVAV